MGETRLLGVAVLVFACGLFGDFGVCSGAAPGVDGKPSLSSTLSRVVDASRTASLGELVETATKDNAAIQAARDDVEASRLMILPEGTLPDPVVSFQNMGNLIPPDLQVGDPSSGRNFGIEQAIPFPGKLKLKSRIAEAETEVRRWNYEQVRLRVVAELKSAYYDYFYLSKSLDVVNEDRVLMSGFADVANARYKVGQGDQRNVLRAQVEILKLVDRKTDIEQRIVAAVSRINGLLNHKPGSPVGKPGDVQKSELPYTLEELVRLALDNAPALKKRQGEIARGTHAVDLAGKDYYPDFTVGFNYIDRDDMREMYGLMVKGTVPLYFWRKQRPALESARLKLESVRKENENDIAAIGAEVEEAYSAVKSADEIVELYRSSLVPQTGLTLEAAFAAYQVGNEDLRELLTSVSVLLDAQLRYYEALADHQKALARLEPLVGFELTK